jgi:hypothetical protein
VCGSLLRTWAGVCPGAASGRSWNPETFVDRELHSCVPAVAIRTPPRTSFLPPLHYLSGVRTRDVKGTIYYRTLRLAIVGEIVRGPKVPIAMQALPALWTHAAKLLLRTTVRRVWGLPHLRRLLYPAETAPVL